MMAIVCFGGYGCSLLSTADAPLPQVTNLQVQLRSAQQDLKQQKSTVVFLADQLASTQLVSGMHDSFIVLTQLYTGYQ